MMNGRGRLFLDILLVGSFLIVAAIVAWLARAPLTLPPPPPGKGAAFNLALPAAPPPKPAAAYRTMVERPLFWADRRRQKGDAAAPVATGKLKDFQLIGAVVSDEKLIAIVRDKKGKVKRVTGDGELNGWRLVELSRDQATFARNAERETLPLKAGKSPPGRRSRHPVINPVRKPRQPMTRRRSAGRVNAPLAVTPGKPMKQDRH